MNTGLTWTQVMGLLLEEFQNTRNAQLLTITNGQMRQWVHRGHVTRTATGYDPVTLILHLNRRFGVPLDLVGDGALLSRQPVLEVCPQAA